MEQYLKVMSKANYANFKGRARRQEFWMFNLIYFIISIICLIVDYQILGYSFEDPFAPISLICTVVHLIPSIAVTVRRFHDVGYSGHFLSTAILLSFVLIGAIWAFVLCVKDGDKEDNQWGANPKNIT